MRTMKFEMLIVETTFMMFYKLCIGMNTAVLQYMVGQEFVAI